MAQTIKSRVEQSLARAHHALYIAYVEASSLRTDDLADDLWLFLRTVEEMQTALLK